MFAAVATTDNVADDPLTDEYVTPFGEDSQKTEAV